VWRAEPDELRAVAGLLVEFRDWWGRELPSAESFAVGVGRLLGEPGTEFLLGSAGREGAPSGFCQLRFRFDVWQGTENCYLEDLFVREGARRAGLGAALLEAALQRARDRGCAYVDLDTNDGNRAALSLYERFGFERLGFTAAPSPSAGRTLLMRLRL
jgi:ribosomal protein S18 acetylase RimI-like enzyme